MIRSVCMDMNRVARLGLGDLETGLRVSSVIFERGEPLM